MRALRPYLNSHRSMSPQVIHDFGHKGLNNDFLIKTSHPLAVS